MNATRFFSRFMGSSAQINRHIWRAFLVVGFLSLLPKAVLVGRELTIANLFGASDQIDAYILALLLPMLLVQVTVNAFTSALMPIYVHKREEYGRNTASNLASRAMFFGLMALGGLMLFLYLFRPLIIPLLAHAFPPAKQALTGSFFILLVPLILLQGATSMWSSLINAEQRFAGVSLLPVITPAIVIAVLLTPLAEHGMRMVAFATLAGALIEAVLAGAMAKKLGIPWPHWGAFDPVLQQVLRRSAPMLIGMALMNCNLLTDQVCASLIGSGSVAMLNYGNKIISTLVTLTAMPISIAVMPYFSALAAKNDWDALRHSLKFWGFVIMGLSIPVTAAFVASSSFLTHVLFPNFQDETHATVTAIQQGYLLQLPFYLLGILGVQMLTALGRVKTILAIATSNFVINLALDLLLPRFMGLPGIALSTSIMYASSTTMVMICLYRSLRGPNGQTATAPVLINTFEV